MSQVRYQLLGPLIPGEGTRPSLALALEQGAPPVPVVVVWAPTEVAQDAMMLARLQKETERAVVFEHPHILRVHGLVTLDGRVARVTEYADGEPLRHVLDVCPRLPPPFAALIAADVAMGVHYAHVAGNDDGTPFVHADLRPETIMVSFHGVVKVSGYGALSVAPREGNGRRVRNRRLYSAPEQLMGGREASSVPTDVFLLGLLLHECLSGRKPFQDSIDPDKAILSRPLPPLPEEVPLPFNEVIRRATAKRAKERYASALAFREALVAIVGELPTPTALAEFLAKQLPRDTETRRARRAMIDQGIVELTHPAPSAALVAAPMPVAAPAAPAPTPAPAPAPVVEAAPAPRFEAASVLPTPLPPTPGIEVPPAATAQPQGEPVPVTGPLVPGMLVTPPAAPAPARRSRRASTALISAVGVGLLVSAVGLIWTIRGRPALSVTDDTGAPVDITAPVLIVEEPVDAGVPPPTVQPKTGSAVPVVPAATVPPTLVELMVSPDVAIAIDGRNMGHTPLQVPLPPGRHMVTLVDEAKGLRTARLIDVRQTTEKVTFNIKLTMGSVLIQAPAGAQVSLDGRALGTAPVVDQTIFEGEHRLRVTQDDAVWERDFVLTGEQRLVFTADIIGE
ncbi:protein kinase domain-containing protein [Archangium primigenium]|uniref:protein kinase domain-containing protein n=1 Tax=[Archangium] primigenium TaxID=2792470 RepID=UPI00195A2A89|nr:protein kinase [Archangium primigenium]MBM7116584.1 protein kinase [Archangium primigenium]